ncbi:hypothetical protein K1719_037963 [Acacia pycnantha]|nr:hypothetical protein K1719_037963 [Acacia pycnantha]
MVEDFATAVEDGLKLARHVYFGKDRAVVLPKPPISMDNSFHAFLPSAPMVYAVTYDSGTVDNPNMPNYQPHTVHYVKGSWSCDCCIAIPMGDQAWFRALHLSPDSPMQLRKVRSELYAVQSLGSASQDKENHARRLLLACLLPIVS